MVGGVGSNEVLPLEGLGPGEQVQVVVRTLPGGAHQGAGAQEAAVTVPTHPWNSINLLLIIN